MPMGRGHDPPRRNRHNKKGCMPMLSDRRLSRLMWLAGFVLLNIAAARPAAAQKIWFVPRGGPAGVPDYMGLFRPDAPWQQAALHVQVFEVPGELRSTASDRDLTQIITDLRRRNIGLAMAMGPLSGNTYAGKPCGFHVEGYSAPGEAVAAADRIKSLGGVIQYFSMDEPLYYGHYWGGTNACHSSIADIAKETAEKIRRVRQVFPQVQFGDVEPLQGLTPATWLADLQTWFDAFHADTGQPLAFFRFELIFTKPWQQYIPPLTQLLRREGIPLQVIYDSNFDDAGASDERAVAGTIANFKAYESGGRAPPDVAAIQFWSKYPSHVLPETDPRSATYMIDQYVKWRQSHH
jgi:hypothetical protein